MTGRYPTSTGMFLNDAYLPDAEVCLAEIVQRGRLRDRPTSASGTSTATGATSYIPPERRQGWDYWKAAECDHNYPHSHYYAGDSPEKRFWEGYDAFAQTKDARGYLRDRAPTAQPFVLLVSYGMPHFPHDTAPEEFKALYPPEKIQLPPNVPARRRRPRRAGRRRATTPTARRWTSASARSSRRSTRPAGGEHDPGLHLRPRRDARLARLPAHDETGALGRVRPRAVPAALSRRLGQGRGSS